MWASCPSCSEKLMASRAPRGRPVSGSTDVIQCSVGANVWLSITSSSFTKCPSDTVTPSSTRRAALRVFSGVMRFSVPRWSFAPQRPQFDSSDSHRSRVASVTRTDGFWVEGCTRKASRVP
jgi:hypothetical protein